MANESPALKIVITVFAVIGLIAVIALIGMWAMHGSMMNMMSLGETGRKMSALCNSMMTAYRS